MFNDGMSDHAALIRPTVLPNKKVGDHQLPTFSRKKIAAISAVQPKVFATLTGFLL